MSIIRVRIILNRGRGKSRIEARTENKPGESQATRIRLRMIYPTWIVALGPKPLGRTAATTWIKKANWQGMEIEYLHTTLPPWECRCQVAANGLSCLESRQQH